MLPIQTTQPTDCGHLVQALLPLRPFEQAMIELVPHATHRTVPESVLAVPAHPGLLD